MAPDNPADLLRAFGAAVRRLRAGRGLSQEQFAELAGLHRTYLGGIERGERNVSLVNINRLARALGLTLGELMTEVNREPTAHRLKGGRT